jgi:hypothetical protein
MGDDYRDGERDMAEAVLSMINDGAPLLSIRDFLEEAIDEVSVPSV